MTIGVRERAPVFADPTIAASAVAVLLAHAERTGVTVWAYCVMPDHVHLVVTPSTSCDIVTFVGQFKGLALRSAWKLGVRGSFWQPRFWDHFVRRDHDVDRVVAYVLENPVRAKLTNRWDKFRFSGGRWLEERRGTSPRPTP